MPPRPKRRRRHSPIILPEQPPLTLEEAVEALRTIQDDLLAWASQWGDGLPTDARARLTRIANTATRALARVRGDGADGRST